MREYGKVHTSFWASETVRQMDDDARSLALYLLTCPHAHQAGVFKLPIGYAMVDMGWTAERLGNGFKTLSELRWADRCEKTGWVWIRNFAKFNPPDNPNQQKAVTKQIRLVPDSCEFYVELQHSVFGTVVEPLDNSPVPAPVPVPKKKKEKSSETTLAEWVAELGDDEAVPADDPLFEWAGRQGIPAEWLGYAWAAFEDRYTEDRKDKTYADWRASFRTHVKKGWLDIWRLDNRAGGFVLTTVGEQWRRAQ